MSQSTFVQNYNSSGKSRDEMLSQQSLLALVRDTKEKGRAVRRELVKEYNLGLLHQSGTGNLRLSVLRE